MPISSPSGKGRRFPPSAACERAHSMFPPSASPTARPSRASPPSAIAPRARRRLIRTRTATRAFHCVRRCALIGRKGRCRFEDGIASSQHVTFQIPGAQADLSGTFNFHNKVVHLVGNLRMDTDISHTTTGFKSFLLKPLAPFFKKKNAGALVPIAVTGEPGHYQVTQDILAQ